MSSGAGFSAVGASIAGYGTFDSAPIQQQTILIDAVTGSAQNARKIDPYTRQYVLNGDNSIQGMSGAQQLVLLRANTLLNSSAVDGLGSVAPHGIIGVNVERQLSDEISDAMQDIVNAGLIEIISITIERVTGSNCFRRYFKWRDLSATSLNSPGIEQVTEL